MPLQQWLECRFNHGTRQVLNRGAQHDSQLAIAMLKSNFLDPLGVDESFEVNNLRIFAIGLRPGGKQKGRGAIRTNRVTDNSFESVIDVITSGANLDGQHQCMAAWICVDEIDCPLQGGKRACAPKPDDERPLHPVIEPHMCNETTTHVRTHVASTRADCQEVHILHGGSG